MSIVVASVGTALEPVKKEKVKVKEYKKGQFIPGVWRKRAA